MSEQGLVSSTSRLLLVVVMLLQASGPSAEQVREEERIPFLPSPTEICPGLNDDDGGRRRRACLVPKRRKRRVFRFSAYYYYSTHAGEGGWGGSLAHSIHAACAMPCFPKRRWRRRRRALLRKRQQRSRQRRGSPRIPGWSFLLLPFSCARACVWVVYQACATIVSPPRRTEKESRPNGFSRGEGRAKGGRRGELPRSPIGGRRGGRRECNNPWEENAPLEEMEKEALLRWLPWGEGKGKGRRRRVFSPALCCG